MCSIAVSYFPSLAVFTGCVKIQMTRKKKQLYCMLKCLASDLSSNFQAHYKGQWSQNHTDPNRFSVLIYLISVPGCVGELSSSYLSDHLHNSSNYNAEYDQRWNKPPANLPPAVHLLSCHRTKIFRKPARWCKKFCYSVIVFQDTKWKYQSFNKL